jgi:transcriptional regulator with XRE-family HTH domain
MTSEQFCIRVKSLIKLYCFEHKITQAEFARRADINETHLSRKRKMSKNMLIETLLKCMDVLGIDLEVDLVYWRRKIIRNARKVKS